MVPIKAKLCLSLQRTSLERVIGVALEVLQCMFVCMLQPSGGNPFLVPQPVPASRSLEMQVYAQPSAPPPQPSYPDISSFQTSQPSYAFHDYLQPKVPMHVPHLFCFHLQCSDGRSDSHQDGGGTIVVTDSPVCENDSVMTWFCVHRWTLHRCRLRPTMLTCHPLPITCITQSNPRLHPRLSPLVFVHFLCA